jgi:hypothetical protein
VYGSGATTLSAVKPAPPKPAFGSKPATGSTSAVPDAKQLRLLRLHGPAALPGIALAALGRDYAFVRDVVVRYTHPHRPGADAASAAAAREGVGSEWGITRVAVAALEERGLLDLAFYAAQV